ncbi:MAG: DUF2293 domain-containing protein [Rhodomicrobium sp.]
MPRRAAIEKAIRNLAPTIPDYEFHAVADRAMDSKGLGAAAPETAAWLSMVSFIRHVLTDYDALLEEGYEQEAARHFVAGDMQAVLTEWGVRRPLLAGD